MINYIIIIILYIYTKFNPFNASGSDSTCKQKTKTIITFNASGSDSTCKQKTKTIITFNASDSDSTCKQKTKTIIAFNASDSDSTCKQKTKTIINILYFHKTININNCEDRSKLACVKWPGFSLYIFRVVCRAVNVLNVST